MMFVSVEIKAGQGREPTKQDIEKNVDALTYIIEVITQGKQTVKKPLNLEALLMDTKSILKGIQSGIPE